MPPAGFPHSDTLGSRPSRRLPEAFRSQTRPSSAPGAKASTVSPYQLDSWMLALAIEFSRCSEARTPRAEQWGRPAGPAGTAALLPLPPNREPHLRRLPPQGLGHRLRVLPTFVV